MFTRAQSGRSRYTVAQGAVIRSGKCLISRPRQAILTSNGMLPWECRYRMIEMFRRYLFRIAKNHVILIAEHHGDISRELAKEMSRISGNKINIEYGVLLHKSKVAINRYAAAAAVFARIAAHARVKQKGSVSSRDWESVTFHAMVKSGANIAEASEVTDFLVGQAYAELTLTSQT